MTSYSVIAMVREAGRIDVGVEARRGPGVVWVRGAEALIPVVYLPGQPLRSSLVARAPRDVRPRRRLGLAAARPPL